jgi:xylulokinase
MAAALGLGLTTGDVALSLGTSGVVYAASPTPTADPSGAVAGFADATGGYLPLVCTLNATKVTDTVAGWLGMDHETFAAAALDAPAGAHGVRLTPYFDGERTPNLPDATGTFATTRRPRIWPEPPMKGCFAACSSDVRPWPPQEQRSMGECT